MMQHTAMPVVPEQQLLSRGGEVFDCAYQLSSFIGCHVAKHSLSDLLCRNGLMPEGSRSATGALAATSALGTTALAGDAR